MKAVRRRLTPSVLGQSLVACLLVALGAWFWSLQSESWPGLTQSGSAKGVAGVAVLLFFAMVIALFRPLRPSAIRVSSTSGLPLWHIFHASQTGFALELATRTATMIEHAGEAAQLHELNLFSAEEFADSRCLFVVSTTGEGDPPDPVISFVQRAMRQPASLQGIEFGILALGDRSYADFCAFGHALDNWLAASGALPMFDLIEVDNAASDALRRWQDQIGLRTGSRQEDVFARAPYRDFKLASRECINPGSAGGAVYELRLKPQDGDVQWQAGDIAEVLSMTAEGTPGPQREYSIASVTSEKNLSLLVRLMHTPEGVAGLGSGWLCLHSKLEDNISVRIRSNPNFHTPAGDRPLILIGNGTGIAGLRAHLKTRIDNGHHRNWMLFGERSHAHDKFYGNEMDVWLESGKLMHLDRIYSRDGHPQRYVQDALAAQSRRLQEWIDDGAVILVCGSQEGMAPGVDAQLRHSLGNICVDQLLAEGRYRRDVY